MIAGTSHSPVGVRDQRILATLFPTRALTARELGRALGLSRKAAQTACDAMTASGHLNAQPRAWGGGAPNEYTLTARGVLTLRIGGGAVRSPCSVRPAGVLAAGIASLTPTKAAQ